MPIKRPYTPDELNQLEAAGYNTSNYKGELIEFPDKPKEGTAAGAGFRAALAELLPSAAGVAAFAAGAEVGGAAGALGGPAAPVTVPVGALVGGVFSGMGMSALTRKAQDIVTPQSIKDKLAKDQEEFPTAVRVGGVAASAPFMRPSLSVTRDAIGAVPQLLAGGAAGGGRMATRAGVDALKNVGLGAGISGATELGRQVYEGELDAGRLVAETAIGAALNKPTRAGHALMGSKPQVERTVDKPNALLATIARIQPTPEEVAALKAANDATKNVNKTAKEVLKAKKLAEEQEALKKALAGKPLPIKPKEATPAPSSETPPTAEPPAAPAPTPTPTPTPAPSATPPVAVATEPKPVKPAPPVATTTPVPPAAPVVVTKPVEVVVAKGPTPDQKIALDAKGILPSMYESATPAQITKWLKPTKTKEVSRPAVATPVETPVKPVAKTTEPMPTTVGELTPLAKHKDELRKMAIAGHGNLLDMTLANKVRDLGGDTTDFKVLSDPKTPQKRWNETAEKLFPKPEEADGPVVSTKPTNVGDALEAALNKAKGRTPVETPTTATTVTRPSVASTAPAVPKVKAAPKSKVPKAQQDEFYAAKRTEHKKAVDELEEAWHAVADGDDSTALQRVVTSYGGKGVDINQFEMSVKPGTNEFVDAVMKLRGDKSKPGKTATKKAVKEEVVEDTTDEMPLQDGPVTKTTAEDVVGEKPEWVTNLEAIPVKNRNQGQQEKLDAYYNKRGTPASERKQENTTLQTPLGKEVSDALAAKKKATAPTTAYRKAVGEIDRGLPPVKEDTSLPHKGQIDTKTGQRTINPDTETLDTRPHETAHDLVRTIYEAKAKGSKRATDYLAKLEQAQQEGLDAYNKERKGKGLEPVDHEEFATSQQGHEFLKQQLNLLKETKWKKWWNDTKAIFNTAYGKNPSIEDLRRVLNFRFVNENVAPRKFAEAAPAAAPKSAGFKDAAERDAAIRGVKDEAGAREVIAKLQVERDVLAKEGMAATMDNAARHSVVNKMMANKMDIQQLADKHGIKDVTIKYQDANEGLPRTELSQETKDRLKGYREVTVTRPDGTTYDAWFNDKYYDMGKNGKFASIAKVLPDGNLTHDATRKGEVLNDTVMKQEAVEGLTRTEPAVAEKTLAEKLKDEMEVQRIHQARIGVNAAELDAAWPGEDVRGLYRHDKKEGYTREGDMTETATHEAVHSFVGDHRDAIKEAILKAPLTKNDLLTLKGFFQTIGYMNHARDVDYLLKRMYEAKFSNDNPLIHGASKYNDGYLFGPVNEMLAQLVNPNRMMDRFEPALKRLVGRIFGKEFQETFNNMLVRGQQGPDSPYVAPGRAKWDAKNSKYYQEANEGLPLTSRSSDILPPDPTRQSFFRAMSSTFDRVGEISQPIAQAARDYENRKGVYQGMANAALVDLSKFSRDDVSRVMAEHRRAYRNDETPDISSDTDQAISKILSDYYGAIATIRRDLGIRIDRRTAGENQYYVPDMMNAETADVFTRDPLSAEATQLKEDWADHILSHERAEGLTREEVLTDINEYIGAMGGKSNNYKSLEFGAIRKAAGYGLPEHMRTVDGIEALSRYSRRAAADLAFFQEIQSKPDIAGPLHIKDQEGHVPTEYATSAFFQDKRIKDMMKWVTNDIGGLQHNSPLLRSTVRLVNNALLGPATGIRDLVSVPMNALPYIQRFSDLGAAWSGMMKMRENSRAALETGAQQPQIDRISFDDVLQSPNRFADLIGRVADGLRKYQGREAIERISREITFSMGKELGRNNIIGARAGDAGARAWLKKFGDLVEGDMLALQGDELEAALNQIGKNFTDRNQGTYGGRGLPAGMVDSQFAPFFTLQKWGVEKANVIYKDVYKPFMTGENRLPMLTYTLGSIMTGAAIQQLNQLMSGKKGIDPTIAEALDKGDPASIAQELATIMQLGSMAGVMSDGVKAIADTSIRGRVPRNIVSFPTATAAVRTSESVTDMMEALRQGEDPWKVLKAFTLDLFTNNIQAARMIANHTVNNEETDRKDKFRDMRVHNELEGKPAGVIAKTNPYLGLDAKEFKKSSNLQEAAGMVKPLVKRAVEKSGGSREQLRASLSSLKGNSYQIMPSPKSSPEEFKKYYDFLVRTQGVDAANARVKDYVFQSSLNKVKSKMIP